MFGKCILYIFFIGFIMEKGEIQLLVNRVEDIIEKYKELETENIQLNIENKKIQELNKKIQELNETVNFYKELYLTCQNEKNINNDLLVKEMVENPYNDLPRLHQTLNNEQKQKLKGINNSIIASILRGGKSKKRRYNKKRRTHKKSHR